MNQKDKRLWLVRTRARDILGPFSQADLQEQLARKAFDLGDEIAPSNAPWVRADILSSDSEEVTRTSTRTQTLTAATTTKPRLSLAPPSERPQIQAAGLLKRRLAPFVFGALVVIGIWLLAVGTRFTQTGKLARGPLIIPESQASLFLTKIYKEIGRGEFQAALEELATHHRENAASDYPQYIIPFSGLMITQKQNTALARKLLTQLLDHSDLAIRAKAHRWMGYLMLSEDEADMGENHFLEALQTDPKDVASRFNLGRSYLKQERFNQSLDYLQLAELEMPELWLIHIYKGRARSELGEHTEAEASFRRAVELEPDRWLSYIYFALFLISRQEKEAAQTTLLKMILRDPQFEQVTPAPWGFFQEKINYGEYLSVFNHVMSGNRSQEKTIGRILLQSLGQSLGQNEKKILSELGNKGNRFARLVSLRRELASAPKAPAQDHLLALKGDIRDFGPYAYVTRAQAYALSGDKASAEADFKFALTLEPQNAIAGWAYADFLKKLNRSAEALSQLERLVTFHPRYIPAILALH